MKFAILPLIILCSLICLRQTARATEDAPATLRTQDFESGEKSLSAVAADSLERFLQDLNQRKDWDYAAHNGQPGPDSAYLFKCVTRATGELERRGYYFDGAGRLHRPGEIVPLR